MFVPNERLRQLGYIGGESGGIPRIIFEDGGQGNITAKSGRVVKYNVEDNSVHIADFFDPRLGVDVDIDEQETVTFVVRTKDDKGNKHPDFYAKKLFSESIEFFTKKGKSPRTIYVDWTDPERDGELSDNYDDFMRNLSTGMNLVEAAKETWAGRLFLELGFDQISEDEIKIDRDESGKIIRVQVKFRKSEE